MKELILALSFLTILPIKIKKIASEMQMAKSLYYYPLVGLTIGAGLVLTAFIAEHLALGYAGDVLLVIFWIFITGALHVDGLMDTADGIFSGQSRERKLEIMRDSRIGAMGAVVLLSVIILKISFINELAPVNKYWVLLMAPALGRTIMVYVISYYPYARTGTGLGKCFGFPISKIIFPFTFAFMLATGYILGVIIGFNAFAGLGLILVTGIIAAIIAKYLASLIGGHTGDTYGAMCEISETLFIILAVIGLKLMEMI